MMSRKKPNANPQSYLLPSAAGQAALKKLRLNYPDAVKWIYQEQKLNDRTTSEEDYPIEPKSVPPDFWPEMQPVFWLPEFEAPKHEFRLFQNPACQLPWYLSGRSSGCFSHLVHPLSVQYFLNRGMKGASWKEPRFLATPMASHRTLLAWNPRSKGPPFSVKTSLNVSIGGLNRNLRLNGIRLSVGMSSLLGGIPRSELERHGILLIDDPVGLMHKQTNAGLLTRDAPWKLDAGEEIVPMFSLVASRNAKRPRIVDLIKSSRLEPTAWVDRFIFRPLIYQAYFLGMTEGVVSEMHEQNMLMELRDGRPTKRFWYRDLGGFLLDRNLRRLAGKAFDRLPARIYERHLGRDIEVFHLLLRMYLLGSLGYAVSHALRRHFEVPADNFTGIYDRRMSELQDKVLSQVGIRKTSNFEKDLDRYRKRKIRGCTWPWKTMTEALRDW
jgi:ferric iron reductase FhuF-like transporter/IucA/IucC family protein